MNPTPTSWWWENASSDEQLHLQALHLRKFLREAVLPFSPHYRRKFQELGASWHDFDSIESLSQIPLTSKEDLQNPRDFILSPEPEVLRRRPRTIANAILHGPAAAKAKLEREWRPVLLTSTTGRASAPVPFFYTQHDLNRLSQSGKRLMEVSRSSPAFRHINAFPFAPHLAFWQAHQASLGFGAFMLSTGGGKALGTEGNIRLIDRIDPDCIIAMPTFLYHLLQQAQASGSRWTNLKRIVLGGEKVPPGMRQKIAELCEALGSPDAHVLATYAFTEAKMAWAECHASHGGPATGFHLYPDMGIVEIIDPVTGRTVPDGHPGEIVFTPIDARGTVVLRYRTGDVTDGGLVRTPCPHCNRTCPRIMGNITRLTDRHRLHIDKLKGTLVDFGALEHLLDDTREIGAWQIELRKRHDDPLECDEVIVHVVPMSGQSLETIRPVIMRRFHELAEFSPNDVRLHDWDEMRQLQGVGVQLKEQKVVDHRPPASS
jgi:phenylacetate-CoA ligase